MFRKGNIIMMKEDCGICRVGDFYPIWRKNRNESLFAIGYDNGIFFGCSHKNKWIKVNKKDLDINTLSRLNMIYKIANKDLRQKHIRICSQIIFGIFLVISIACSVIFITQQIYGKI